MKSTATARRWKASWDGFAVSSWVGLIVPAGTDPAIIETLNAAVNTVLADEASIERFTEAGAMMHERNVEEVAAFFDQDLALLRRWLFS